MIRLDYCIDFCTSVLLKILNYDVCCYSDVLCPSELLNGFAPHVSIVASVGAPLSPVTLTTTGWNTGLNTVTNQFLEVTIINIKFLIFSN